MQPVRPQLKPALRRVWRDGTTLQLGVDPARAVVIGGLDARSARLVESLDGSRDLTGLHATAARLGIASDHVDDLLVLLARSGVLEDAAADHRVLGALPREERDRLAPDLAAASIAHPGTDGGVGVLSRRRDRVVTVHGAGRVGAPLVTLLAAAGVGTVVVEDAGETTPADLSPAGLGPDDVGARRQEAAAGALRRFAASVRTRLPAGRAVPDLAVLSGHPTAHDARVVDRLVRAGVPHLFARVRDVHRPGRAAGAARPVVVPALPRPAPRRPRPGLALRRRPAQHRRDVTGSPPATSCSPQRSRRTPGCRCSRSSTATRPPPRSTARSRSPVRRPGAAPVVVGPPRVRVHLAGRGQPRLTHCPAWRTSRAAPRPAR